MKERTISLTVSRCAHGAYAVSLDHGDTGVRLTPERCCGRWAPAATWTLTGAKLREIANEIECAAELADSGGA